MDTPDVKTINEIIEELMGPPCTDGNCRGCVIQRSVMQSSHFKAWLINCYNEAPDPMSFAFHIAALSFQMGELFERKKEAFKK